jgi:hypothetical protein
MHHDCTRDVCRYQTRRIEKYRADLRRLAEKLFDLVSECVHAQGGDVDQCCIRHPGSFSIVVQDQKKTVAKIVMYERPCGKRRRTGTAWDVEDGVYIWVRAEDEYEQSIQRSRFARFQGRYARDGDRRLEVYVAPNDLEHFYYFGIGANEDLRRLADFLAFCSTLREGSAY